MRRNDERRPLRTWSKVLEETGVVTRVVSGRTHRLSLEPRVLSEAADWMDRQRALWGRLFDVVDEYLKNDPRILRLRAGRQHSAMAERG